MNICTIKYNGETKWWTHRQKIPIPRATELENWIVTKKVHKAQSFIADDVIQAKLNATLFFFFFFVPKE